jgi:hypothetical protein
MSSEPKRVGWAWVLCRLEAGEARTTTTIIGIGFFGEEEIPQLSLSRVTREQIQFCFAAQKNPAALCRFD